MRRSLGLFGAAMVLCAVIAIPVGTASAVVIGTGSPTCTSIVGKFTFSPPLKTAGTATHEHVSVKGKVFGCAGGVPVPVSGKLAGKGVIHGAGANACPSYFPTGTMTFTTPGFFAEVEWSGGIEATKVFFPTLAITNAGGASPEVFHGGPTAVTGSYLPSETLALATVPSEAVITSAALGDCGSVGGLKHVAFGGTGSTGSF
jgi:hypothetical protein